MTAWYRTRSTVLSKFLFWLFTYTIMLTQVACGGQYPRDPNRATESTLAARNARPRHPARYYCAACGWHESHQVQTSCLLRCDLPAQRATQGVQNSWLALTGPVVWGRAVERSAIRAEDSLAKLAHIYKTKHFAMLRNTADSSSTVTPFCAKQAYSVATSTSMQAIAIDHVH